MRAPEYWRQSGEENEKGEENNNVVVWNLWLLFVLGRGWGITSRGRRGVGSTRREAGLAAMRETLFILQRPKGRCAFFLPTNFKGESGMFCPFVWHGEELSLGVQPKKKGNATKYDVIFLEIFLESDKKRLGVREVVSNRRNARRPQDQYP